MPMSKAPRSSLFAPAPAQAPAPQADDPMEALTKLKKLFDAGLIEQAEFDAKKAEILSRL